VPNIAVLLKEEITRLARKETRQQLETLKKASAQYRSDIASLKREVARLTQQGLRLNRTVARSSDAPADGSPPRAFRFVAKGLRAHRSRLGLSATKYALLAGVSPQAIYNWESGTSRPRASQLATIANLRRMGKREATERLGAVDGTSVGRRSSKKGKATRKTRAN
jgi:DNA-binding XRE family transcriptional regulator